MSLSCPVLRLRACGAGHLVSAQYMWAATITFAPLSFGAGDKGTDIDESLRVELGQQKTARERWDDLGLPFPGGPLFPSGSRDIISIQEHTILSPYNIPQRIFVLTLGQVLCDSIPMTLKLWAQAENQITHLLLPQ